LLIFDNSGDILENIPTLNLLPQLCVSINSPSSPNLEAMEPCQICRGGGVRPLAPGNRQSHMCKPHKPSPAKMRISSHGNALPHMDVHSNRLIQPDAIDTWNWASFFSCHSWKSTWDTGTGTDAAARHCATWLLIFRVAHPDTVAFNQIS
jgi:hypothetical protein